MWLRTVCEEATSNLEFLLTTSRVDADAVRSALQGVCVQLTGRDLTRAETRRVLENGPRGFEGVLNDFLHERAEVLGLLWEPLAAPERAAWRPEAAAS